MIKLGPKTIGVIVILTIGIFTIATASADSFKAINFQKQSDPQDISYVDVSWAMKYANLTDMAKSSDIIVVGKIANLIRTDVDPITNLSQSYYNVTVLTPIKPVQFTQTNIVVTQTGGLTKKGTIEIRDDPLLVPGDTTILFLKSGVPASLYHIIGGPEGRFIVTNNDVYSLDVIYADKVEKSEVVHIDGQSLNDFIKNVKGAVS